MVKQNGEVIDVLLGTARKGTLSSSDSAGQRNQNCNKGESSVMCLFMKLSPVLFLFFPKGSKISSIPQLFFLFSFFPFFWYGPMAYQKLQKLRS